MLNQDAVQAIKDRFSVADAFARYHVSPGRNRRYPCPFADHEQDQREPATSVDGPLFYCHKCSKGGDVFTLVQALSGTDFPGALSLLGEWTGVKVNGKLDPVVKQEWIDRQESTTRQEVRIFADMLDSGFRFERQAEMDDLAIRVAQHSDMVSVTKEVRISEDSPDFAKHMLKAREEGKAEAFEISDEAIPVTNEDELEAAISKCLSRAWTCNLVLVNARYVLALTVKPYMGTPGRPSLKGAPTDNQRTRPSISAEAVFSRMVDEGKTGGIRSYQYLKDLLILTDHLWSDLLSNAPVYSGMRKTLAWCREQRRIAKGTQDEWLEEQRAKRTTATERDEMQMSLLDKGEDLRSALKEVAALKEAALSAAATIAERDATIAELRASNAALGARLARLENDWDRPAPATESEADQVVRFSRMRDGGVPYKEARSKVFDY